MSTFTWMGTRSGVRIDLLDPRPELVHISDIAYALARIKRFHGHTNISVAEHSVQTMWYTYANPELLRVIQQTQLPAGAVLMLALLHDAHEAYVGDISRPMNNVIQELSGMNESPVNIAKRRIQQAIHLSLDLPSIADPEYRRVMELVGVADRKLLEADRWRVEVAGDTPWGVARAERLFLRYFYSLYDTKVDFVGQHSEWPSNEIEVQS